METNENEVMLQNPTSDFDPLKEINEHHDLVITNLSYVRVTNTINRYSKNVFENYLRIGFELDRVQEKQIYLVGEYQNVFDYAKEQFGFSTTAVKNMIAISKRFCNDGGYLLEKYKNYSFSSLVELVSMDDQALLDFTPDMTVKEIRNQKFLDKVQKKYRDLIREGTLQRIIKDFLQFPWDNYLNCVGIKVSWSINTNEKDLQEYQNFTIDIRFDLYQEINIKGSPHFLFHLEIVYFPDHILYRITNSSHGWFYQQFELDQLYTVIKKIAKHASDQGIFMKDKTIKNKAFDNTQEEDAPKDQSSPGVSKILPYQEKNYRVNAIASARQKAEGELLSGIYIDESTSYKPTFHKDPKRHAKKNPPLFRLIDFDDPGRCCYQILDDKGEVKEEIHVFPSFEDTYKEHLKQALLKVKEKVGLK